MQCPECGSTKVTKAGFTWKARRKVQRMRCTDCGRVFTPEAVEK